MTWTLRWGRVSHRRTYGSPVVAATGKGVCFVGKCSLLQNVVGTRVSYWNKFDTEKSGFVPLRLIRESGISLRRKRLRNEIEQRKTVERAGTHLNGQFEKYPCNATYSCQSFLARQVAS